MPIRFFLKKVSPCGIDPGNASPEIRDRLFTPGTPLIVGQTEERGRRYAAERKLQGHLFFRWLGCGESLLIVDGVGIIIDAQI